MPSTFSCLSKKNVTSSISPKIICLSLLLISLFGVFMPIEAQAQQGPQRMLPPLNCPTVAGASEGLLQWRDDGVTPMACASGVTVDNTGSNLTVTGTVQVGSVSAPANSGCSNTGAIRYNTATGTFEGCNGSQWITLMGNGGSCAAPNFVALGGGSQLYSALLSPDRANYAAGELIIIKRIVNLAYRTCGANEGCQPSYEDSIFQCLDGQWVGVGNVGS